MNKLATEDQEYALYEEKQGVHVIERPIYIGIYYYSCPFFLLLGTAGNVAAAIALQRMISKVLSTCAYAFVVVLCDLLVLYMRAGNIWYYYLTGNDIRDGAVHSSNVLCKLYPFFDGLVLHMGIWTLVAMATEIAIGSLRPYSLTRVYRLKRATAAILLLVVLLVCLNAHCFWSYALVKMDSDLFPTETLRCTNAKQGHHDSEEFRKTTWPVLEMVLADLVPLLTIFSCVVIVFTRLSRDRRLPPQPDPWLQYPFDAQGAKDLRRAFAIICVFALIFLVTKFGNDIFKFLIDSVGSREKYPYTFTAKQKLANCACDVVMYLFVSCKCLIFLATSERFRLEFKRLLRCYRWSDSDPSTAPNINQPSRHTRERYRYKNVNGVHPAPPRVANNANCTRQFTTTTV